MRRARAVVEAGNGIRCNWKSRNERGKGDKPTRETASLPRHQKEGKCGGGHGELRRRMPHRWSGLVPLLHFQQHVQLRSRTYDGMVGCMER